MRIGDRLASIAWAEARTLGVSAREYSIDHVSSLANLLIAECLATRRLGIADIEVLQILTAAKMTIASDFPVTWESMFVRVRTVTTLCLSMFK